MEFERVLYLGKKAFAIRWKPPHIDRKNALECKGRSSATITNRQKT
jgi:hypothetical protein